MSAYKNLSHMKLQTQFALSLNAGAQEAIIYFLPETLLLENLRSCIQAFYWQAVSEAELDNEPSNQFLAILSACRVRHGFSQAAYTYDTRVAQTLLAEVS